MQNCKKVFLILLAATIVAFVPPRALAGENGSAPSYLPEKKLFQKLNLLLKGPLAVVLQDGTRELAAAVPRFSAAYRCGVKSQILGCVPTWRAEAWTCTRFGCLVEVAVFTAEKIDVWDVVLDPMDYEVVIDRLIYDGISPYSKLGRRYWSASARAIKILRGLIK